MKIFQRSVLGLSIVSTIFFNACSNSDNTTVTGILADGAIGNARYECAGKVSKTNVKGQFTCKKGVAINFYYGNVRLGGVSTLPADRIVLIQDILGIARADVNNTLVTRLAVFLQSLDNDADHTNGIYLDPTLIENSVPISVEFTDFNDANVSAIFDAAKLINATLLKVVDTDAQSKLQVTTNNVRDFQNIDGDVNTVNDSSITAIDRAQLDTLIAAYIADNNGSDAGGTYANQIINANTSQITDFSRLFVIGETTDFNLDISGWDTSNITTMSEMFAGSSTFNQDISSWNTSSVTNMDKMFFYATAFSDQNLSSWNIANVTTHTDFMSSAGAGNTEPSWSAITAPLTKNDLTTLIAAYTADNNGSDAGGSYADQLINANTSTITNFYGLFKDNTTFNLDISKWNTSRVQYMAYTFQNASSFNQDLSTWNTSSVILNSDFSTGAGSQTIEPSWPALIQLKEIVALYKANHNAVDSNGTLYSSLIINFDTSSITNMSRLFYNDTNFDLNISAWNTSNVTDLSYLFSGASSFNQDISAWNTSNVTNMISTFYGAVSFNKPLNSWNVSKVTTMYNTFYNATIFNQPLSSWNTSSVTKMNQMFYKGTAFNQNINSWNVANVTSMVSLFGYASSFNQNISDWNTSNVTDMLGMFANASAFNQNISTWNTSNVTDMSSMFYNASSFSQDLSTWNVSSITRVPNTFSTNTTNVTEPIWVAHTVALTDLDNLISSYQVATGANKTALATQIINHNLSNITSLKQLFSRTDWRNAPFNLDISGWNTSNITDMSHMFSFNSPTTSAFNQDISSWDTSNVTNMSGMFYNNMSFNQNISGWNTSKVADMGSMFGRAVFNQDISNWDTSSVKAMSYMFYDNTAFTNKDLSSWNVSNVTEHTGFMQNAGTGNTEPTWP